MQAHLPSTPIAPCFYSNIRAAAVQAPGPKQPGEVIEGGQVAGLLLSLLLIAAALWLTTPRYGQL